MKTTKYVLAMTLGVIVLVVPSAVRADSFSIAASERGWVCSPSGCGNFTDTSNSASPDNNYLAGLVSGAQFRNWFEFSVPTLTGGSLVSATLTLDEPIVGSVSGNGHVGGALTYAVYGLSAQPLIFTDVTTSNPYGSVGTSSASDGTSVAITLDAAALAAISADQGGNIFIGGIDSGEISGLSEAFDFGDTDEGCGAAICNSILSLQTASAAAPEPSSLLLLATGLLGLMGMGLYKKRLA